MANKFILAYQISNTSIKVTEVWDLYEVEHYS